MIELLIFTLSFLILMAVGIPIAFAFGLSGVFGFILIGAPLDLFAQRMWTGLDSFVLVSLPFFILAGELMHGSGILARILEFSKMIVGRFKGGLLYVNTLVAMLFGGINGSAVADASAVGTMLIPAIRKDYEDAPLAAAITSTGSIIGTILPPSVPMIIYAFAAGNVSIAALFMAGIVPGILLGLSMFVVTYFIAKKYNYPADDTKYTFKDVVLIIRRTIVAGILPLILIVGIVAGIVTPTEAGAVGVLYALFVGFFITKELTLKEVYASIGRTVNISAIVLIMMSIGNVITWWLTMEGAPEFISSFLIGITSNAMIFLVITFIIFLFIGLFLEQAPAMVMLVPIFAPLATTYGIDPIHFGLFVTLVTGLGLITPPVGICLFVTSSIARESLGNVFKRSLPYFIIMTAVSLMVTLIPQTYMWVPRMFGF